MIKVAIVGNIASGKSTVENILQQKGFIVYDTDKIAHSILAKSDKVLEFLGTNDRKELASIVFSDKKKLDILESIIHPEVKKEIEEIFNKPYDIVFVSVPQLFEAGFEKMFDKIIYVTADEDIRLERLVKRNSYSIEEAKKRIQAQHESNKKEKSDFIIENNGSYEVLEQQVTKILSILVG